MCNFESDVIVFGQGDPVFDGAVECPRHGSEFDLSSGEPASLPATRAVPVYALEVEGDDLYVSVEPMPEEAP